MARLRIRHHLQQMSEQRGNPLYPEISAALKRKKGPSPGSQQQKLPQQNKSGSLGLNWKDAVVFSLLLIFGGIYQVRAQQNPTMQWQDIHGGVMLFAAAGEEEPRQLALIQSKITVDAVGIVASAHLSQVFHNPHPDTIESATYAFGLPDNAAVYRLRLQIGKRVIEGEIHEKKQAKAIYQQARAAGQKASLLLQQRPNLFTTQLSHIEPGETVQVDVYWQQSLRYDNGVFELRLPLATKPRYLPPPLPGQSTAVNATNSRARTISDNTVGNRPNRREVQINLQAGFPLDALESLYHPIAQREDKRRGMHIITWHDENPADNHDFVLRWRPHVGKTVQAVVFQERREGLNHQLVMLLPPQPADKKAQASRQRQVTFVVDTSGSMYGPALDQARDALLYGLQQLNPGDYFNLIEFNSQARALFDSPQAATGEHLAQAMEFVDGLEATGSTNMQEALQLALPGTTAHQPTNPVNPATAELKQVIFITDGAVDNEKELFRWIDQHLGDTRLFTVGIGGAPNSHFMRKAAAHGRGTFTYIAKLDEVNARMSELYRKISAPALTSLELDIDPLTTQQSPRIIPDLYLGEPLFITLRGKHLPKQLSVYGQSADEMWQKDLAVRPYPAPGIARLWARNRVEELLDERALGLGDAELLKDEITELALAYHLVSPFTALVAVDKNPPPSQRKPTARTKMQAGQLPFPQTALGWRWQLASGLALLGLALGLDGLTYRRFGRTSPSEIPAV